MSQTTAVFAKFGSIGSVPYVYLKRWGPLLGVVSAVPGMVPVTVPGAGLLLPVARAEVTAVVGSVEVMGGTDSNPDGEKKSGRAPVKAANPSR